ncbi:MAG TPA: ShlB/FhaC/HecB family hemolysin secretion/activation protein [Chlamydiales bacterium]|nr:ShlB/FhaC/HecB family hemolysin secretion/activation protein [Chlamydiales bacterium]
MRLFLFFFFCAFASGIVADEEEPPSEITSDTDYCLRGILLSNDSKALKPEILDGVEIQMDLPGASSDLRKRLEANFLGRPLTKKLIAEIKNSVVDFYRSHSRPIVAVIAPEQDISDCALQLLVIESCLGEVEITGNCYFSSDRLCNYLRVYPSGPIESDVVNQDLFWINKNPFRQVDLVYKPGTSVGTTDILMVVQDRRPCRVYTGIDNTGNDFTGNNRLFAGLNWGNAFGLDHILSFQFTADDQFKRFLAYTLHYTIPLPWRHLINLYGGYSSVDTHFSVPEAVGSRFRNHGFSGQASFRYDIPFKPDRSLQEFTWGFDWKRTNNNLAFSEIPVFSKIINLTQFMVSYNFGYESRDHAATLEVEGFASPFEWLPDQSNADYQTLRPFAKNKYAYGRGSFTWVHHFTRRLYYNIFLRGQAASANLLPSEEYGLGGYDTVRGYKERIVNGDDAFVANVEFLNSPVPLLKRTPSIDSLQFLVFGDYGAAFVHQATAGQKSVQHLYSVGTGLRYKIGTNISVRADWGYQLHHIPDSGPNQRLHFQAIASY